MSHFQAFAVSASGLDVQKVRMETVALNLANMHTTRGPNGEPFRALEAVVAQRSGSFDGMLAGAAMQGGGAYVVSVQPSQNPTRLVYEPSHPDAGVDGYVEYPNVDSVAEMVKLMEATRAYEANVKAINVAKAMALRALEIGGR